MRTCSICDVSSTTNLVETDGSPVPWFDEDLCGLCGERLNDPRLSEIAEALIAVEKSWAQVGANANFGALDLDGLVEGIMSNAISAYYKGDQQAYRSNLVDAAAVFLHAIRNTDLTSKATCRACGCTDITACIDFDGHPCHWAEPDLCSKCARKQKAD